MHFTAVIELDGLQFEESLTITGPIPGDEEFEEVLKCSFVDDLWDKYPQATSIVVKDPDPMRYIAVETSESYKSYMDYAPGSGNYNDVMYGDMPDF